MWSARIPGSNSCFRLVPELSEANKTDAGWQFQDRRGRLRPEYAFLGVRACELAAMRVQDRVFFNDAYVDPIYQRRRDAGVDHRRQLHTSRRDLFLHVDEYRSAMPSGFDLALTELAGGFVVEVGTERGRAVMDALASHEMATDAGRRRRETARRQTAVDQIGKALGHDEHPRTAAIQSRASALGRRCRALSVLHQLHDGLPDLFLQFGRVRSRTWQASMSSGNDSGIPVSTSDFSYIVRRQCPRQHSFALSSVADAQAGILDRPVRHVGLRRLRPLHHLVSGRH